MIWKVLESHSYITFAAAMLAVTAPIFLAARLPIDDPMRRRVLRYECWLVTVALGFAAVLAIRYLVVARPVIEGVDFFFYVVKAQELLNSRAGSSNANFVYGYFPGVYAFWKTVMALFGNDLATLQWAVVLLLLANAVLVAAIVTRTLTNWQAGVIAALWYVALASRFEGLYGTSEPIATLFALAGVLCWGGLPLRGGAGWRRMLLLGAGLGLALWGKQQGGLLSIGAVTLITGYALVPPQARHSLWQIILLPFVAASIFLVAILLEGEGLRPIREGLVGIGQYEAHGSLLGNLRGVVYQMGFAGLGGLVALLLWVATLVMPRLRPMHREPWTAIVGFSLFASLATFLQFSKRPYLHYALLLAPFLSIAAVTTAFELSRKLSAIGNGLRSIVFVLIAGLLCVPLIESKYGHSNFHVWPPAWNPSVAHEIPWHMQPDVASDLPVIATLVAPGEDLMVLPPRRYIVHFLFGSRIASTARVWAKQESAYNSLKSPTLDSVLIIDRRAFDLADVEFCKSVQCSFPDSALVELGFVKAAEGKTMTLWRRAR